MLSYRLRATAYIIMDRRGLFTKRDPVPDGTAAALTDRALARAQYRFLQSLHRRVWLSLDGGAPSRGPMVEEELLW